MPHAFDRICNGFFINNTAGSKTYFQAKPLRDHTFQDLDLDLSHDLCMNLMERFLPHHMKLGFFLLQLPQLEKCSGRIAIVWKIESDT